MSLGHDLLLDLGDYVSGAARDQARRAQVAAELRRLPRLLGRTLPRFLRAVRAEHATLASFVALHARRAPESLAVIAGDEQLTFAELDRRVTAVARALRARGLAPGARVALIGAPSPAYLASVLGAARAGVATVLVSPALRGELLQRALDVAPSELVLVEADLDLELRGAVGSYGREDTDFERSVRAELDRPFEPARVAASTDYVHIFTSGTTGLPKACRVTHERALLAATTFSELVFDFEPGDRVYAPLPLHHSSALLLAAGSCLVAGVPLVLRRRFSKSEFFADVRRHQATIMLYIGELCRALLTLPERADDRDHGLRLAVGNGLAPDVWGPFVERFGIREVHEFYAATDTPSAIVNLTSERGSVGHVPLRRARGFRLARLDPVSGEPLRNRAGRCEECAPGEVGELLLRIRPRATAELGEVPLYTDEQASLARVLRDVFETGDSYYRSFDRFSVDRHGYFRFVERASESFRYKGENVSTSEVEGVLRGVRGVRDVAVVGVKVPGVDGYPPLAALVTDPTFDWATLGASLEALPEYARPCFVRLVPSLPLGETLKIARRELVVRGAEPRPGETVRVRSKDCFEELTPETWRAFELGMGRL